MISVHEFTRSIVTAITFSYFLTPAILPEIALAVPERVCVMTNDVYLRDYPSLKPIAKLKRRECYRWTTISGDWILVIGGSGKTRAISRKHIEFVCDKCKIP
jgi:hypothetical protein